MGPAYSLPFQYFYCQLALAMAPSQLCKVVLALKEHSGVGPGQASVRQAGMMPSRAVLLSSSRQEQGLLRHPNTPPHVRGCGS